jgi:flagellar biosynthesis anti-sigma factor FlgM
MIISSNQVQYLLRVYDRSSAINSPFGKEDKLQQVRKADRVDISTAYKIKQKAIQGLNISDPIREKKLEELKTRFQNGTYEIDSDLIAEKMIQRAIIDELV